MFDFTTTLTTRHRTLYWVVEILSVSRLLLFSVFLPGMKYNTAASVVALALSSSASAKPLFHRQNGSNGSIIYDITKLPASEDIKWIPCFSAEFTCTRLKVPLDYEDPDAGTTGISFVRWSSNSTNSSTQDILINPGGPGGSGVDTVLNSLGLIQQYVGTHHNIIGFDPRSVNGSGPEVSCFPGTRKTSHLYGQEFVEGAVDVNNSASIGEAFARWGAVGDWCTQVHSASNSTAKYANTVATATDMLTFIEALATSRNQSKEDANLSYFGISYGTVLGSTFAALFPDRIQRMILDAVVDADDYYQGKWSNNIPDADAAVRTFFRDCHAGGSKVCQVWEETPEAIERRVEAIIDNLAALPISVSTGNRLRAPRIVTVTDLKLLIGQSSYSPTILYPILSRALAELENGTATTLSSFTNTRPDLDSCSPGGPQGYEIEPRYYIACNDANNRFNVSTLANYTSLVRQQYEMSKYLGEWWAHGTGVACRQIVVSPPESQIFPATFPSVNKTSSPILFVGNTYDPVTPLRHAKKMSKYFAGAGVLQQNSAGHGVMAAASKCTGRVLREYIQSGNLPAEGTVCEVEEIPFKTNTTSLNTNGHVLRKRHHLGV